MIAAAVGLSFVGCWCLAYTASMLRRVVRWIVAGVALALALHVYMLSGHSNQAHGPLAPLGAASHRSVAAADR
jgi:hypothetical protein